MGNTCTKDRGKEVNEPLTEKRSNKVGKQKKSAASSTEDTIVERNALLEKGSNTAVPIPLNNGQNLFGDCSPSNDYRDSLEEMKKLLKQIFNKQHAENYKALLKQYFQLKISDTKLPTSIIEVIILVKLFEHGVTIYNDMHHELCSLKHSSALNETQLVELLYTEGCDEVGHYDTWMDDVESVDDDDEADQTECNCLFKAYNKSTKQEVHLQKAINDEILTNQEQLADYVADILVKYPTKLTPLLVGGIQTNPETRVPPNTHQEIIKGRNRYTIYTALNGVHVEAIRTYGRALRVNPEGVLESDDGSQETRLHSMKVKVTGLNLQKNHGLRCLHTHAVSGMPKRSGGKRKDSCVSFHLAPSMAGANAGNAYANAVMASTAFNTSERGIWGTKITINGAERTLKNHIGERNFSYECEVDFEALIPEEFTFDTFFDKMNTEREAQGKKVYHETNKEAIRERLKAMQRIDNRACRVKWLGCTISVDDDILYQTELGPDYELFIPPRIFTNANQKYQLAGENLDTEFSCPKVQGDKFNRVPGRIRDDTTNQALVLSYEDKLQKFKEHHNLVV